MPTQAEIYKDGTIVEVDIASSAVTTAKINDSAVTTSKINDSAVTTSKINDSAVTTSKIADASVTAAKLATGAAIPTGVIVMWYGSSTTSPVIIGGITYPGIPSGWALCDGSTVNNLKTPDLRERFIVGAGGDNSTVSGTTGYNPNDTGGANEVTLNISQIPQHNHNPAGYDYFLVGNGDYGGDPRIGSADKTYSFQFSSETSNKGGSGSHENRPPYYALAYIMKI